MPTLFFVYFLQTLLKASIAFSCCLLFVKENVLAVFSISFSSPNLKSSKSFIGSPLTVTIGRPIVTVKGLPINDFEDFRFGLENEIEKTARTFSLTNSRQQENAIDAFKSVCKKYTKNKVGKRPFTNINIVQI